MNKKYVGIVAGMLLLAGCSNDEMFNDQPVNNEGVKSFTTFTGTLADVAGTRAYLGDADESGTNKRVFWDNYESITVFSDVEPEFQRYSSTSVSDNVATFSGNKVTGNKFYALYPNWGWEVDEDNPNIVRRHFQGISDEDGNYWFYAPMVATSTGNDFSFKQTTGLIHVSVGGMYLFETIGIQGNNNEKLSWDGYIDLSEDQPVLKFNEEASDIGHAWGYSMNLDSAYTDFYFILPPMTFEKGFSIDIIGHDAEGNFISFTKKTSAQVDVKVATVTHFDLVDVNAELEAREAKTKAALKSFYDALDGENWGTNWFTDAPMEEWDGLYFENGILKAIDLSGHGLTGEIPAAIDKLTSLEHLILQNNAITSIPAELSALKNLRVLDLGMNQISGNLPESIAELTNLVWLQLSDNEFEGEIPVSYFNNLSNLNFFNVQSNKLVGKITPELQLSPMWQHAEGKYVSAQKEGYGIEVVGPVEGITLEEDYKELQVGETYQIKITEIFPETAANKNVVYEYYDSNIVSVDENGLVTALAPGWTNIRVKAQDNNGAAAWITIRIVVTMDASNEKFEHQEQDW